MKLRILDLMNLLGNPGVPCRVKHDGVIFRYVLSTFDYMNCDGEYLFKDYIGTFSNVKDYLYNEVEVLESDLEILSNECFNFSDWELINSNDIEKKLMDSVSILKSQLLLLKNDGKE